MSSGLCENNDTTEIEDYSGSGSEDYDFVNMTQPIHGKKGKKGKHPGKVHTVKFGKLPKKSGKNNTYSNLTMGLEQSSNVSSEYINPILISCGCAFVVIGSVLLINKYHKKSGYNLVDNKNYNTFQNV